MSHTPSCFNQMSHAVSTKFPADFPNVVFERIICANIVFCLLCALEEFLFCHDFPDAVHKELQHIKPPRSQVESFPI